MNGPDLELQGAIVTKLKADTALRALIGNPVRLYQDVPANPQFPYVIVGEGQNVPDLAECIDGSEIFNTIHVFSRAGGYAEAKRIVATLDAALHDADLTLTDHRCITIQRDGAQFFSESDGATAHGVVTYRALVEPTV